MNRLFGNSKPKAPAPNLTDCVSNVSVLYFVCLNNEKTKNIPSDAATRLPGWAQTFK